MFSSSVALELAYSSGARIANMSWSGDVPASLSFTALPFDLVTRTFRDRGMLLFAAAGNDHNDVDDTDCFILDDWCWEETWVFPCENGGVTCIGAIDTSAATRRGGGDPRSRASYSNYGASEVDLFAPGTLLVGPDPTTGPGARATSGTSFASPFAAGVAALVWAADPTLSADAVESTLLSTAHVSPDPQVRRYVDAGAAVAEAADRSVRIDAPTAGQTFSLGRAVELLADVYDDGHGPATLRWTSDGRDLGTGARTFTSGLVAGRQTILATASWGDGVSRSARVTVDVHNDPPTIRIDNPLSGTIIEQSQRIGLSAWAYDPNGPLSDSAVTWHLDGAATPFARGRYPASTALPPTTLGEHLIVARVTDGVTTVRSDPVRIRVIADDGIADPTGVITNPARDVILIANATTPDGQAVHELALQTNAPGPDSPPVPLLWTDQLDGGPEAEVARGNGATVRLFGEGCGTRHRLALYWIDGGGDRHLLDWEYVWIRPAPIC
jgi:hypothetical protein